MMMMMMIVMMLLVMVIMMDTKKISIVRNVSDDTKHPTMSSTENILEKVKNFDALKYVGCVCLCGGGIFFVH